jgi:putative ABC transport system ATP-binding protein
MVTHDPGAASHTDRVVFLADGRVVDEMRDPTADLVLERMKSFEKGHVPGSAAAQAAHAAEIGHGATPAAHGAEHRHGGTGA